MDLSQINIPTVAKPLFLLLSAETKMKIFRYDDTDGWSGEWWTSRGGKRGKGNKDG